MFNLFRSNKNKTETFFEMFPSTLKSDVEAVTLMMPKGEHLPHRDKVEDIILVGPDPIRIYSRIYNPEPNSSIISNLTAVQQLILSCVYTRHHNGYVRQKHLMKILENETSWTVPFVVRLLGEYVIEVVEIAKEAIEKDVSLYKKFSTENPAFWEKTKARMTSYWNVYYKKLFENKEDYPALQIVKIIEE